MELSKANVELARTQKDTIINEEIASLKRQVFENEINIAKWSASKGDYDRQIEAATQTIEDLIASIEAISQL
jgi:hypothetical protein